MDEETLQRIKKTLVVILKTRNQPSEVALLGLALRWEPSPVENNNYYDENSLWGLNIYLPAEAYARGDRSSFSDSAEIIKSTLNEITAAQRDIFVSVAFFPELVEHLSFTQEQLLDWLEGSLDRNGKELITLGN